MSTAWDEIKNIALIGTDKKDLNEQMLPVSIKNIITNFPTSDKEAHLLKTAAFVYFYNQCGTLPAQLDSAALPNPIIETSNFISDEMTIAFKQIEELKNIEIRTILERWLDKVIEKQEVAKPEQVLSLINMTAPFNVQIRSKVVKVIGKRGLDILPFKTEFNTTDIHIDFKESWKEGNTNQRLSFIKQVLDSNPNQALQLIQEEWTTESVVFKKSVLELLSQNSNPSFFTFFENLYETEFIFKLKEKKTETECRYILTGILSRFTQSNLYQYLKTELSKYVVEKKKGGFLGFGKTTEYQLVLPQSDDSFFNKENMLSRFGIQTTYDPALFKNDCQFWFSELLATCSFVLWNEVYKNKTNEIIKLLADDAEFSIKLGGKKTFNLTQSLLSNATTFKDTDTIFYLLENTQDGSFFHLVSHLETKDFEWYIEKNNLYTDYVCTYFNKENTNWSVGFSEKMLRAIYKKIVDEQVYVNEKIAQIMALNLNPLMLSDLKEYAYKSDSSPYFDLWLKNFYQPIKTTLEIRKIIAKA